MAGAAVGVPFEVVLAAGATRTAAPLVVVCAMARRAVTWPTRSPGTSASSCMIHNCAPFTPHCFSIHREWRCAARITMRSFCSASRWGVGALSGVLPLDFTVLLMACASPSCAWLE